MAGEGSGLVESAEVGPAQDVVDARGCGEEGAGEEGAGEEASDLGQGQSDQRWGCQ